MEPTEAPLAHAAHAHGITDPRVLRALATVDRRRFVAAAFAGDADEDAPLPIPHRQVTTQPSLVANMVEALGLQGDERVLEIGTGLGYQAAILSELAREVFTVERFGDLAERARANLSDRRNVQVVVGDGSEGLPAHAPYDAIVVAAAALEVPLPLVEQLREGGRLVMPIGPGGAEEVRLFRKQAGRLVDERLVTPAYFVRLIGRHGVARFD